MQSQFGDSDKGHGGEVTVQELSGESLNDTNNEATHTENEGSSVSTGEPVQLAC